MTVCAVSCAAPALAREPLVIIRFNQPRVYYEQQLYQAMSKAVAIKPELMIDVVSFAPQASDSDANDAWQQAASKHTQQVVAALESMGVPRARIQVSGERLAGIRADETHIFVR